MAFWVLKLILVMLYLARKKKKRAKPQEKKEKKKLGESREVLVEGALWHWSCLVMYGMDLSKM